MNIFLDDIRQPYDCLMYMSARIGAKAKDYSDKEWVIARSHDEFVEIVTKAGNDIQIVSFDHDLADEHYDPDLYGSETYNEEYDKMISKTGYDSAKWFKDYCLLNKISPTVYIHTQNPVGLERIKSVFY